MPSRPARPHIDLPPGAKSLGIVLPAGLAAAVARPNKYHAERTVYDGVTYDSKAEALHAAGLDARMRSGNGDVAWWVRQVTFRLGCPENTLKVDFLVAGRPGGIWVEEVKGRETAKWRRDRRLWMSYAPVAMRVIVRGKVSEILVRRLPR
jgi:hypothetical protein